MEPETPPSPDRGTALERDSRRLRDEARQRLGPPPTDAELRLLKAGTLDAAEADRVRDWLALDDDWARAFRELDQEEDLEELAALAESAGVDVKAGWQRLGPRLGEKLESNPGGEAPREEPAGWARRLAWAALIVLGVGLSWLALEPFDRGPSDPPDPGVGPIFSVPLESVLRRDGAVEIPRGVERLELRLPVRVADGAGPFRARLFATDPGSVDPADPEPAPVEGVARLVHESEVAPDPVSGAVAWVIETRYVNDTDFFHVEIRGAPEADEPLWESGFVLFELLE